MNSMGVHGVGLVIVGLGLERKSPKGDVFVLGPDKGSIQRRVFKKNI